MARPQKIRKVLQAPSISGFKPYGGASSAKREAVFLLCEEYEALRLNDYEKHNQCESAAIMQVSRPTFTRIYMSAREKIATAFVEGRKIIIEGGKVEYDQDWYSCAVCGCFFNRVGENEVTECTLCGSHDVTAYLPSATNGVLGIETGCNRGRRRGRNNCRR
ncbi:MAG: DUF134 domain-containing protein [Bacteroides sp.]|jgi:predicted DNA-binding protein (UPF0251 family)|nr:DUF134 domain-containing protein [Bacteroides sp.]